MNQREQIRHVSESDSSGIRVNTSIDNAVFLSPSLLVYFCFFARTCCLFNTSSEAVSEVTPRLQPISERAHCLFFLSHEPVGLS